MNVRVFVGDVVVLAAVPKGMTMSEFDNKVRDAYEEIANAVDVRDVIKQQLTDRGGPLEGYDVTVTIS